MIDRAAWPFTGLKPRARIHRRGPPPGLPSSAERIRAQLRAHAARREWLTHVADIFIKVAAGEMQQNRAALLLEFVAESDREEILQIVVNRVTQDVGGIVEPIVRKTAARLFRWRHA
jgi:hypothetical protein